MPSKECGSSAVIFVNNISDDEAAVSEFNSTSKHNFKTEEEMAYDKVFGSDITRAPDQLKNNLYDILRIDPVKPLAVNNNKNLNCDFIPKTDKHFIPKKKIRLKVYTVRDIRNWFEKDVYNTLENDLEKQQNNLLRKIRGGSSKDEKTKLLARNMLKSEKPISRVAWQMLLNVNPDDNIYSSQYVLWNGKKIQVNGSRGGKSKFICKYDLGKERAALLQKKEFPSNSITKRNLLKHSLNVKFKPGPLSRKKQLDVSYQKYNIGFIELVNLPKPGLDITPEYGKPLESSITNFLHQLRDVNGIISEKWAEFAVSTLGTEENGRAVQINKKCCITFDLHYKYNQSRLLGRYDRSNQEQSEPLLLTNSYIEDEETTREEVKHILDEMITSVEINLLQNNMYSGKDSPREIIADDINSSSTNHIKRKGELNRLDVTIIRLSDSEEKQNIGVCHKSFCTLGCVCDSILSSFHMKKHCGRIECMFECKCNFSKLNLCDRFEHNVIPGLVNLDKENNLNLSKEERKFHQTVVLSGEKSIILKSQRRNWKAPKRYAEFYSHMCLKTKKKNKRILSVVDMKLNCTNIEPWCMIHNLYKCFCKGKFTERLTNRISNDLSKTKDIDNCTNKQIQPDNLEIDSKVVSRESTTKVALRPRMRHDDTMETQCAHLPIDHKEFTIESECQEQCSRTKVYNGRKYSDLHYYNANNKIKEMEENDHGLRKRMMNILNNESDEIIDKKRTKSDSDSQAFIDLSKSPDIDQSDELNLETRNKKNQNDVFKNSLICDRVSTDLTSTSLNKKLKSWLEPILTMYRQRFSQGFSKKSLDPPKGGKVALYPWDFILGRYVNKKNIFLVSDHKPFRIFMAVDSKHTLFENCININDIVNLDIYPISVKNIVTNNTEMLKDQLCILRGLDICWELIGSVKKLSEVKNQEGVNKEGFIESSLDVEYSTQSLSHCKTPHVTSTIIQPLSSESSERLTSNRSPCKDQMPTISLENDSEQSRWFVMTLENDFNEIQFYKRGFFVKFDSIVKAIKVARVSKKTVRLSSQKFIEGNTDPHFGIYAIPNEKEYCVFIGPYEKNEPLGIETIKTALYAGKKRTRGVWISTNKFDNIRVIDNPLLFMSQVNMEHEEFLDDALQDGTNTSSVFSVDSNKNKIVKLAKPIKIAKTNNFYHLTSTGVLKQISTSPENQTFTPKTQYILNKSMILSPDKNISNVPLLHKGSMSKSSQLSKKPVAEIAPQVKVIDERPENSAQQKIIDKRKFEGGMLILKPEEINKRSLVNCVNPTSSSMCNSNISFETDGEIEMDIENFLANSVECSEPSTDIYVISDDEDYCNLETNSTKKTNEEKWQNVWIICKNICDIGWVSGRQNAKKHLSFEFPGFNYTDFYPQEEAFVKITQVLSRKIYVPKQMSLEWGVVETKEELKDKQKLKQEDLCPDYVLTKQGLMHKLHIADRMKMEAIDGTSSTSSMISPNKIKVEESELLNSDLNEFEMESNSLEAQTDRLWREAVLKQNELSNRFTKMAKDKRQEISDRLRSIISSANNF